MKLNQLRNQIKSNSDGTFISNVIDYLVRQSYNPNIGSMKELFIYSDENKTPISKEDYKLFINKLIFKDYCATFGISFKGLTPEEKTLKLKEVNDNFLRTINSSYGLTFNSANLYSKDPELDEDVNLVLNVGGENLFKVLSAVYEQFREQNIPCTINIPFLNKASAGSNNNICITIASTFVENAVSTLENLHPQIINLINQPSLMYGKVNPFIGYDCYNTEHLKSQSHVFLDALTSGIHEAVDKMIELDPNELIEHSGETISSFCQKEENQLYADLKILSRTISIDPSRKSIAWEAISQKIKEANRCDYAFVNYEQELKYNIIDPETQIDLDYFMDRAHDSVEVTENIESGVQQDQSNISQEVILTKPSIEFSKQTDEFYIPNIGDYQGNSLVAALSRVGYPSNLSSRELLASGLGIVDYVDSPEQHGQILNMLKEYAKNNQEELIPVNIESIVEETLYQPTLTTETTDSKNLTTDSQAAGEKEISEESFADYSMGTSSNEEDIVPLEETVSEIVPVGENSIIADKSSKQTMENPDNENKEELQTPDQDSLDNQVEEVIDPQEAMLREFQSRGTSSESYLDQLLKSMDSSSSRVENLPQSEDTTIIKEEMENIIVGESTELPQKQDEIVAASESLQSPTDNASISTIDTLNPVAGINDGFNGDSLNGSENSMGLETASSDMSISDSKLLEETPATEVHNLEVTQIIPIFPDEASFQSENATLVEKSETRDEESLVSPPVDEFLNQQVFGSQMAGDGNNDSFPQQNGNFSESTSGGEIEKSAKILSSDGSEETKLSSAEQAELEAILDGTLDRRFNPNSLNHMQGEVRPQNMTSEQMAVANSTFREMALAESGIEEALSAIGSTLSQNSDNVETPEVADDNLTDTEIVKLVNNGIDYDISKIQKYEELVSDVSILSTIVPGTDFTLLDYFEQNKILETIHPNSTCTIISGEVMNGSEFVENCIIKYIMTNGNCPLEQIIKEYSAEIVNNEKSKRKGFFGLFHKK